MSQTHSAEHSTVRISATLLQCISRTSRTQIPSVPYNFFVSFD